MTISIEKGHSYLPGDLLKETPLAPEILVPRLGEFLVEQNLLSPGNLERALTYQQEQAKLGKPILIGQALRELNLITADELDQAVTRQILKLQTALQQSNVQLEARVRERTAELERALEKLTELNQLKSNFIANISHELRTPLTHIKGYLDILAEGGFGPLSAEQNEAVSTVRRSEERLESLIEDILQFSQAESGELQLEFEAVNIAELSLQALDQATVKADRKDIMLVSSIPEHLPLVICDRVNIAWVLNQLLDNAIKFTEAGGRVGIEVELQGVRECITVFDTGMGIPNERIKELFEPFHQLDGSSTRAVGGTGLGLALSSRILQAHHTEISVQSIPHQGSRFYFTLPLSNE